ncbi:MAG: hypothetical protein ABWY11_09630 [Umezawaea sp.]
MTVFPTGDEAEPGYLGGVDVRHSPCGTEWDRTADRHGRHRRRADKSGRYPDTVHSGLELPPKPFAPVSPWPP